MKLSPASGSVVDRAPTTVPLAAFSATVEVDEGHVGGRLVDVGDADGDGLGEGVSGRVGDPDLDIVAGGGLEVEQAAVGDDEVGAAESAKRPPALSRACR